jgi:hypothetical protein
MAEPVDQNLSALNQEALTPDQQVQAGRMLPQQQKTSSEEDNLNNSKAAPSGHKMERAGKGMQTAGKGMEAAGKGLQTAGSGAKAVGKGLTAVGEGLSGTGAGAVVGVPLAAAGSLFSGAGTGAKAVGKGAEVAGKGAQKAGEQMEGVGQSQQRMIGRALDKQRQGDISKLNPKKMAQSAVKSVVGYSYGIWLIAFILAGSYDLYNIVTMETGSEFDWIADLILGGGLTILLWTQGSKARQAKKVIEEIISMLLEIIPGVGLLPCWTIMVIWQFYKAYNEHEMEQIQEREGQKTQGQASEEMAEESA